MLDTPATISCSGGNILIGGVEKDMRIILIRHDLRWKRLRKYDRTVKHNDSTRLHGDSHYRLPR